MVARSTTGFGGFYRAFGLPDGTYGVRTPGIPGYLGELYLDVDCPLGTCNPFAGLPVTIAGSNIVTGIDLALNQGTFDIPTVGETGLVVLSLLLLGLGVLLLRRQG